MRRTVWTGAAILGVVAALTPAARAADEDAVKRAVDRGVAYLKQLQQADGTWPYQQVPEHSAGATALAGLTLLECGTPANDQVVQKATRAVRERSIGLTTTYSLSLAILFLDRLGEPADEQLIESMAIRLLAGQNPATGGWTYDCPPLPSAEVSRLQALLRQRNELVAKEIPRPAAKGKREASDLPKEIQQQLQLVNRARGGNGISGNDDNSNTQFATLALWVARRQGIPVDDALRRVETRFRGSQHADGGWSYTPSTVPSLPRGIPLGMMPGMGSTPAMTCAGLLGLAFAHGNALERAAKGGRGGVAAPRDPNKDHVVKSGLLALGTTIGQPFDKVQANPQFAGVPPAGFNGVPMLGPRANGKGYYFLWSLERVAVAYGLKTIGKKDWYGWGSDILVRNQGGDGSWVGEFAEGGVDTCFALMFLSRANLAEDLTTTLKGKVDDPNERELRAGGAGGADLMKGKKIGLPPAFENGEKPVATKPMPKPGSEEKAPSRVAQPAADSEVAKLSEELIGANPDKRETVLDKLRDSKGAVYTDALALAIPKLTGADKSKARDALADRMARMTITTLKDKLEDEDLEIRRAAALACAMKEDKTHIARLVELLEDPEPPVSRAAHAALKSLTGEDFGPDAEANRADVTRAVAAWRVWWRKNRGK